MLLLALGTWTSHVVELWPVRVRELTDELQHALLQSNHEGAADTHDRGSSSAHAAQQHHGGGHHGKGAKEAQESGLEGWGGSGVGHGSDPVDVLM